MTTQELSVEKQVADLEQMLIESLRTLRLAYGFTQKRLCVASGIGLNSVGKLERGAPAYTETLLRLLVAYGFGDDFRAMFEARLKVLPVADHCRTRMKCTPGVASLVKKEGLPIPFGATAAA